MSGYLDSAEFGLVMARRRKQSPLEDLVDLAVCLPWKAGVVLAVIAYVAFHYMASLPLIPVATGDMKNLGQSLGGSLGRQMLVTFSTFLQYLVPLALAIGSCVSFFRRRRQQELHSDVASNPSRNALEKMSWQEFEGLAAETFRRQGYRVVERGGNGPDGGVDLDLYMGKDKYLVQCKQWKVSKVGVATVRELYGVMTAEHAVGGFVVASGEFTDDARNFAEGRSIKLVATQSLLRLISNNAGTPSLSEPKEVAAVPACPKCGGVMVQRTAKQGATAGSKFWGCASFPNCRGIRN